MYIIQYTVIGGGSLETYYIILYYIILEYLDKINQKKYSIIHVQQQKKKKGKKKLIERKKEKGLIEIIHLSIEHNKFLIIYT